MGEPNREEDVSRWDYINDEVDRVMRRAVIGREATEADKGRIERELQEKLRQAEAEFMAQKAALQNQLSQLRKNNTQRAAELSKKESQHEELKKKLTTLRDQRGQLQDAISETTVVMMEADRSKDIALQKKKNAEQTRAEKAKLVAEAEHELEEAREAQRQKAMEHEGLVTKRGSLENELAELELRVQELAEREQDVDRQKKAAKEFETQLIRQKNEELKLALVPFDQEMQDRLATRKAALQATYRNKMSTEGPDVEGINSAIVAREKEIVQQKHTLADISRQAQEVEEVVGAVRKLQAEVDDIRERVREEEKATKVFKNECDTEVERARIAYEKEKVKNDSNIRRERLEEMRAQLEVKIGQMKEVLGAVDEDVAGMQGSTDVHAADSLVEVVSAGTQVVFDGVNPIRRTFRLLNLQPTAIALDGWTLSVAASGGEEVVCDLIGVVLPAKGYVLFSCGPIRVSESYVHLTVTTEWAAAGGQMILKDASGNNAASVDLAGM